ncbi:DNA-binding transcriptional regulator, MarR family [Caloranaerobacter azorensis DSM 13643]|uniref:DNA-binding transcriptional regulator, MarR family n=1 Tax=Caloranaerobacter azorensis DSM 13643 TaxID=1121264 RepID=A0A1M5SPC7_9FIRM|nr:MarR family transcriptional regulator [Caloranaerobacter azorensis]SHH40342.1 DNA-binding transcriptional regulator, MarR family [Caloranaerobacter azorensis DSM 13643]
MSQINNVEAIEKYLRKVDSIIKKKGREILKEYNITGPQFNALQYLIKEGDLTIGEISEKLALAYSTITDLVDRMEKNGLVVRVRDDKDRRVVRIKVLDKGFEILQKVLNRRIDYLEKMLSSFTEEEKSSLVKNLEKLYISMEREL